MGLELLAEAGNVAAVQMLRSNPYWSCHPVAQVRSLRNYRVSVEWHRKLSWNAQAILAHMNVPPPVPPMALPPPTGPEQWGGKPSQAALVQLLLAHHPAAGALLQLLQWPQASAAQARAAIGAADATAAADVSATEFGCGAPAERSPDADAAS